MDGRVKKVFQKRFYDLLSHKYGILLIFGGAILLTVSAFHFGEAWLEWSHEKYEAVFNSFSDNIVGKSFRERLSLPVPIDVVYTWVNGSDPDMIAQLESIKMAQAKMSNVTREEKCTYMNCLPVGIAILPALPASVSLADLTSLGEAFSNVTSVRNIPDDPKLPANLTLIAIPAEGPISQLMTKYSKGWQYMGHNYTLKAAFYTSDSKLTHGLDMPDLVMISGYPRQYTTHEMQKTVATHLKMVDKADTLNVKLYIDKGVALVQTEDQGVLSSLLKDTNFTLENKVMKMASVRLVWDLSATTHVDEIADYRFQDKEELRYSLRSVEQYAPWVRHVYIVTNGQIPFWMNLDNPRISVVTHAEIFPNASHLPTFSSPAIEANLHRIPGLSDKFLYLNDDVMFGQPVWPDDFYSHSTGQKLYLSWPVPNCNEGCPSTWINDGYCDKACNSSECEWDGGDCKGKAGQVQLGAGFHGGDILSNIGESTYCQQGCANNWLADKYCDQSCNSLACGFDAGDCGTDNFDQLYGIEFDPEKKAYQIPPGETMAYFNLTNVLGTDGKVTAASHEENRAVRAAAVGNKFKVMVLLLFQGHNRTASNFSLSFQINANLTSKVNFTVTWDTSVERKVPEKPALNDTDKPHVPGDDDLDAEAFIGVEDDKRRPVPFTIKEVPRELPSGLNLSEYLKHYDKLNTSEDLQKELKVLHIEDLQGLLTEKGLKRKMNSMYQMHKLEIDSLKTQVEKVKRDTAHLKEQIQKQAGGTDTNTGDGKENKVISPIDKQSANLDHPAVRNNLPVNQGIQNNLPVNQGIQNNLPVNQGIQNNLPVNQGIQNNLPVNQGIQNNLPVNQGPQNNVPVNQGAQNNVPVNQGPQNNVPVNQGPQNNVPVNQGAQNNVPVNQGAQNNVPVNQGAQNNVPVNQGIQENIPVNHGVQNNIDVNPNLNLNKGEHKEKDGANQPGGQAAGRRLLASSSHVAQPNKKQSQQNENQQMIDEQQFIKLVRVENSDEFSHRLPWEERLNKSQGDEKTGEIVNEYSVERRKGRHLLDAFGDSLRHVNRIYNKVFGFTSRKVPAHMPHMIDKHIMKELQDRFPEEWDATSSHKIRHSQDMQYAFAYYYFINGVTQPITTASIFDKMDTDKSGILSDRELRTFAAKMYDLPLYLETLTGLEKMFINCSQHIEDPEADSLVEDKKEVYYDKEMPQVTKHLFIHCHAIVKIVSDKFHSTFKYKTTIMDDSDVAFKIIHSNVSRVVGQLDDVRKNPKKFICLNDNMEHSIEEASTVKAVLQDFYESVLPTPSQFELPREYRNRFLHIDELRQWRRYRDWLKFWTHTALIVLVVMTIASFLGDKLENLKKKFMRRKRHKSIIESESSSESAPSELPLWQNGLETV